MKNVGGGGGEPGPPLNTAMAPLKYVFNIILCFSDLHGVIILLYGNLLSIADSIRYQSNTLYFRYQSTGIDNKCYLMFLVKNVNKYSAVFHH